MNTLEKGCIFFIKLLLITFVLLDLMLGCAVLLRLVAAPLTVPVIVVQPHHDQGA
jgi:hypothetical protein